MFSLLSQSFKFIRMAAAVVLLPLLAWSCQLVTDDYDCENDILGTANKYINVTISVSASDSPVTRANPTGGEYGDGTEKGINDRENKINDITLIFYQDATGINTSSNDAIVACVKRYNLRLFDTTNDLPNSHTHKTGNPAESSTAIGQEMLYTTGNQRLDETTLEIGKTYKVLVVANTSVDVAVGDLIKNVREKTLSKIYEGTGSGIDANNFVMTSEADAEMTLVNPTIDTSNGENKMIYYSGCIHIERLAARIDYCTKGGTYDSDLGGYRYSVGTGGGFFVVTKVTPFNLYNENEYVFKRVYNNWTDPTPSITYLGDESTTNYVADPNTANKYNNQTFSYLSPIAAAMDNSYTQTMTSLSQGQTFVDGYGFNNVIIGYPRENTLRPSSYLMSYATGIAFEVKVYVNASAQPSTHVYYHYLRHQGEDLPNNETSYKAKEWGDLNSNTEAGSAKPMNFGVVRNNIYRISIESLNQTEGTLNLNIEEEKWRHVDNPTIYI